MEMQLHIKQHLIENHSELILEFAELGLAKILYEYVGRVFTSFNVGQLDLSLSDKITDSIISNINVFVAYFSNWVASHKDGSLVVIAYRNRTKQVTKFKENGTNPHILATAIR